MGKIWRLQRIATRDRDWNYVSWGWMHNRTNNKNFWRKQKKRKKLSIFQLFAEIVANPVIGLWNVHFQKQSLLEPREPKMKKRTQNPPPQMFIARQDPKPHLQMQRPLPQILEIREIPNIVAKRLQPSELPIYLKTQKILIWMNCCANLVPFLEFFLRWTNHQDIAKDLHSLILSTKMMLRNALTVWMVLVMIIWFWKLNGRNHRINKTKKFFYFFK